ncbi:MAG TPA: BA14K family protein [Xanthobacteraceae bacterium]|nr:BA14K family protein [Xanthobacteraceae bacterium]
MPARTVLAMLATSAVVLTAAAPAQAQRWGHHHHRHYHGGSAAAGIAGFAAGALIGGALASQPRYAPGYYPPAYRAAADDEIAYCQSRFRSYDPASGTYLGYDGRRHPCP